MAIEDAYELAYREAVRALENQRSEAVALQSRAGMLLAAASIAVSFGRESLGAVQPLAWLAALSFVLLSLCVLAAIWPRADRTFSTDPQALLAEHLASAEPDATALSADLIARIATHHRLNARRLEQMSTSFRIGACLLATQMLLTLIAATVTV